MLKSFMATALILGSTLTISAPVMAKIQEPVQGKTYQIANHRGTHVCTRDRYGSLNLRTRPSLRSRVIRRIPNGSVVAYVVDGPTYYKNWAKINYEGTIGWVSRDYLCHY
ncbi:MAG: SH3 domain-containing protein [Cyanobacteria bacterium J06633_8]